MTTGERLCRIFLAADLAYLKGGVTRRKCI